MTLDPSALTTLEAVKAQLDIEGDSEDGILISFIEAATAAVETYCRRRFAYAEDVTETVTAHGQLLFLRRPPILKVHEVRRGDDPLPEDEYDVAQAEGIISLRYPSPSSPYMVRYDGGFVTPNQATQERPRTLPRDVELAALLVVTSLYRNRGRDPNVTEEGLIGARQAFAGGWHVLSPAAQALLAPWRLSHP